MNKVSLTAQTWFNNAWERAKNPVKAQMVNYVFDNEPINTCVYHPQLNTPGCFIGVSLDLPEISDLDEIVYPFKNGAFTLYDESYIEVSDLDESKGPLFLDDIQCVHDFTESSSWHAALSKIAEKYNLETPETP